MDFMKKKDLKLGMVVETRNRKRFLLILVNTTRMFVGSDKSIIRLESYFSDLSFEQDGNFDIMKVYLLKGIRDSYLFSHLDDIDDDTMLHLLWERREPVEITMEQIAEKFGLPMDMIKVKEG